MSDDLNELPMKLLEMEQFFNLIGTMQFELILLNDTMAMSYLDEVAKYGMRNIERKRHYSY